MNTYCNLWAVKVTDNTRPVEPGDLIPVTTKSGKQKTETVLAVISRGEENGKPYTLCAVVPKEKNQ